MIGRIFQLNRKKNYSLSLCILIFNLLAAFLEGISFILLLASLTSLNGENIIHHWVEYLPLGKTNPFLACLLSAITLQIFKSVGTYLGQLMTGILTLNIQHETQKQIFKQIFSMSFSTVAEYKKGDLMQVATSPSSFIPIVFDEYNRLITSCLMVLTYLTLMGRISFSLTCINMALFAIAAFIQRFFFKKINKASHLHAHQISHLSQHTSQCLEGVKTVHLFQRQEYVLNNMKGILHEIAKATLKMKKWNALIPCLNEGIGIILVGLSLVLGVWILHQEGLHDAARVCVYLTLTYRLGTRLQQIMSAKGILSSYSGQFKRLETILQTQIEASDHESTFKPVLKHQISFEGVSLRYPHKTTCALKDISLHIPKKKIVALVGASGAGKSSLIDLLLRLYSPTQGTIALDGIPIDTFCKADWRKLFGVVPQDAFLFNATIEENIRFGSLEASYESIVKAAEMAGADSFIRKLPSGYHTRIGEKGYRLSGGERQRISLAAALVRDPEILVLDEATSHLDSGSEHVVQEALLRLHAQKTMLVIAHRLSTIQMADWIYVLDRGTIIESGTHQDLLNLNGTYQKFWHLQTNSQT